MKRFIRSSKYLDDANIEVLFDDSVLVEVDVTWPTQEVMSSSSADSELFPGINQFKQDVLQLLEDEYHFEVIEDVYDGKRQKGYITNREDSVSIYFDTYFDLSNAGEAMQRLGITKYEVPKSGKVFCFVHIRISDHELNDSGDVLHGSFVKDTAQKYAAMRNNIVFYVPEENIVISNKLLQRAYSSALSDLRDELDFRISLWAKRARSMKDLIDSGFYEDD